MWRVHWLALFVVAAVSCTRCQSNSFSTGAWLDRARNLDGERCPMADELIGRKLLLGKSESQLDALLGPAENTVSFRDWERVYWLCDERGLGVDSEWLTLHLDGGVVVEARIQTD
jgi:hypothetical protein